MYEYVSNKNVYCLAAHSRKVKFDHWKKMFLQ